MDMEEITRNGRKVYKKKKNFKLIVYILLELFVSAVVIFTELKLLGFI